jgi:hypothetical protein
VVEIGPQRVEPGGRGSRQGTDYQEARAQARQLRTDRFPQPALDPMAYDGVAHGFAHHDADAWRAAGRGGGGMYDDRAARRSPSTHGGTKLVGPAHSVNLGKHLFTRRQAARRVRPLRRRPARIALPARVRIRSRNPCVLLRRRLFG